MSTDIVIQGTHGKDNADQNVIEALVNGAKTLSF